MRLLLIAGCLALTMGIGCAAPPASGTTSGGSTAANQTNGQQKSQDVDASGNQVGTSTNPKVMFCPTCSVPSGGATQAKQDTAINALNALNTTARLPMSTLQSGAAAALISCDQVAVYDDKIGGSSLLVVAVPGQRVYVCGYKISGDGSASAELDSSTGGAGRLTPAWPLGVTPVEDGGSVWRGLASPPGAGLYLNVSAPVPVTAIVYFTRF